MQNIFRHDAAQPSGASPAFTVPAPDLGVTGPAPVPAIAAAAVDRRGSGGSQQHQ
jgi:hypothetical protein